MKIVKCAICGEDTTHNTESSFYGSVHRFGPTDHDFVQEEVPCLSDMQSK